MPGKIFSKGSGTGKGSGKGKQPSNLGPQNSSEPESSSSDDDVIVTSIIPAPGPTNASPTTIPRMIPFFPVKQLNSHNRLPLPLETLGPP